MRLLILMLTLVFLSGCSTTYPNQTVTGMTFPSVKGQSLEQDTVNIPEDFANDITLLLVGYKQNSQFDIDRWLIGLDMTETDVPVYEIPTIQGMFPKMFSTVIDNGMRAGIPKSLWQGVITVYEGGDIVQQFTGNENGNNARVLLIDKSGGVLYFHDEGFSVAALNKLRSVIGVN